jgi:hypothetical protein
LQNFFFLPASCNCRKTSGLLNKSSFYLFIFGGELLHPCNNNKKSKMEIFSHKFPDLLRNNSLILNVKKKKKDFFGNISPHFQGWSLMMVHQKILLKKNTKNTE